MTNHIMADKMLWMVPSADDAAGHVRDAMATTQSMKNPRGVDTANVAK